MKSDIKDQDRKQPLKYWKWHTRWFIFIFILDILVWLIYWKDGVEAEVIETVKVQKDIAWVYKFGWTLQASTSKHLLQIGQVSQIFFHANKRLSIVLSSGHIHANVCLPGAKSQSTSFIHESPHQQWNSLSSLPLTMQGREQSLADASSSLPLQMGQECSLIRSMEKVAIQTWKNAGAKLKELRNCVSDLSHDFLSALLLEFLKSNAPFS